MRSPPDPEPAPPALTPAARDALRALMREHGLAEDGAVRISLAADRSDGARYVFDFDATPRDDEVWIDAGGVALVLGPPAREHLAGAEIDWLDDFLNRGFVFRWPGRDEGGCGSRGPDPIPV